MMQIGAKQAYALDGGQTAALVMNDRLVNRPDYGTQRKISDIIYFATAIPEKE
jgi:exopolysaccharide biosynthesis protein